MIRLLVGLDLGCGGSGELTDCAWRQIEPLLPPVSGRGRRWRGHRQVINAILWKLRTGAPWGDLPERYGPWKIAHERLRLWTADGMWQKIHLAVDGRGLPVRVLLTADQAGDNPQLVPLLTASASKESGQVAHAADQPQ